ncbi:MAG: SDR family oxidoreductase [Candidatus Eremiobacteraeota bacterium]|nr:SDR family oxidoreductase [Candidatus Eremiobacteraeota bacterium]
MKVLVTGASGKLGSYLMRHDGLLGGGRSGPDHQFDLCDSELERRLGEIGPEVVIHTAALSAVADCLHEPEKADLVNHQASARLGRWCADKGVRLVYVSTDMVFDGETAPYDEEAVPAPVSEYGRSKLRGERAVLEQGHLVARVALMVGPALGVGQSYYDQLVANLRAGRPASLFQDEWRGMISYEDAAEALVRLALGSGTGIVHLAGPRLSRLEMGRQLSLHLAVPELVSAGQRSDYPSPEPRPRDLTMVSRRWEELLPGWRARKIEEQIPGWLS